MGNVQASLFCLVSYNVFYCYVTSTNKMRTFQINVLIHVTSSAYLKHVEDVKICIKTLI